MHRQFEDMTQDKDVRRGNVAAGVPLSLRSRGDLDLFFCNREGRSRINRAYQSGCLRMRLPRTEAAAERPCAVIINTAGGVAGGDRLDQRIAWGEGAIATVTTQAAEKVYRALAEGAEIATRLEVGAGADAEFIPQETILFDQSRLRRDTQVLLAGNVTFLGLEAVVLGRAAMGETMRRGMLRDRLRIWRGGRLIYADTLTLDGEIDALMRRAAIGDGARGMAVIVHASATAESLRDPVREALENASGLAAASCWNGLLAVRLLAPDGEILRHDIALALGALRQGLPLPRVWRC
ncbi:MAG TPA: urease accessory protein UreD [Novosphingobium sp.]